MNRLAETASDYLLQHAHQRVDWWPWSEAALAHAVEADRPVLLSVGYASCHWCHVMSHESFDDPAVAEFMNEHFVAIKVDRQQHPDVDAVYMTATQAMNRGSGGWPMTAFLTPEGKPFFTGTYFPPEPQPGMPSFMQVLEAMAAAWEQRREEILTSADAIVEQLTSQPGDVDIDRPDPAALLEAVEADFDLIHGGFGSAPKFPPATLIDALLVKGDPTSLDIAQNTCEHLVRGGIFDQVGGGFHRYSTDSQWIIPHFEKMLCDNALLLGTMARCWRRTADHDADRRELYSHAVRRTIGWLEREMTTDEGLFAASLDADSDDLAGHSSEGAYYLWSPDLLVDALGRQEADWLRPLLHIDVAGNFEEGLSTLQMRGRLHWERINEDLDRLLELRQVRPAPARDDKVITAWNAMAIDSLVEAGMILREWGWVERAASLAEALWAAHWRGGQLLRTSLHGIAGAPAVAEDHAHLGLALAGLAGATGQQIWLERAVRVLETAVERFSAADGSFLDAEPSELLPAPSHQLTDDACPSVTATMVKALRRVALMAERTDLMERADRASTALEPVVAAAPRYAGWALADHLVRDEARRGLKPATVVVVEENAAPGELAAAAWRMAPSGSALVRGRQGTEGFGGWFAERGDADGPTAYVCRGTVCFEPVTDYLELKDPLWRRV